MLKFSKDEGKVLTLELKKKLHNILEGILKTSSGFQCITRSIRTISEMGQSKKANTILGYTKLPGVKEVESPTSVCPSVVYRGQIRSGVLCSVLGTTVQEGHSEHGNEHLLTVTEKGNQYNEGPQMPHLRIG